MELQKTKDRFLNKYQLSSHFAYKLFVKSVALSGSRFQTLFTKTCVLETWFELEFLKECSLPMGDFKRNDEIKPHFIYHDIWMKLIVKSVVLSGSHYQTLFTKTCMLETLHEPEFLKKCSLLMGDFKRNGKREPHSISLN